MAFCNCINLWLCALVVPLSSPLYTHAAYHGLTRKRGVVSHPTTTSKKQTLKTSSDPPEMCVRVHYRGCTVRICDAKVLASTWEQPQGPHGSHPRGKEIHRQWAPEPIKVHWPRLFPRTPLV
ncbi:hypothetical protein B0T21DRAFT_26582 [Apiosordaria backusii]|uniref:Secreted protein n=1 Tax=Apiosordaria backusii TaxID=314023 RepID=A0AA40F035_9PEZI|nr:hypothetical protein B0T21DRAFT_26582 [Apiosordaria backusii]